MYQLFFDFNVAYDSVDHSEVMEYHGRERLSWEGEVDSSLQSYPVELDTFGVAWLASVTTDSVLVGLHGSIRRTLTTMRFMVGLVRRHEVTHSGMTSLGGLLKA